MAADPTSRWRIPYRRLVCVIPPVVVIGWAIPHWRTVQDGFLKLLAADRSWLLAALVLNCLTWVAVAIARQGAVVEKLPAVRLLATQCAASSANHVLPVGLGAGAVNLRFLTVCGLPLARSSATVALYVLAESVGRVTLLLALLVAFPEALRVGTLLPGGPAVLITVAVIALVVCGAALLLARVPRLRAAVLRFARTALSEARSVHRRPARVLALWGGLLAFPALQACGMVTVALALDLQVPVMHVAVAYLAASCLASLVPTPGGFGSVEAALVLALVTAGAPATAATATVLAFRIVTVWLPLLPGALLLGALVRWKVI